MTLNDGKKHYLADNPVATHFRRINCKEAECPNWEQGWKTTLPVGHELVEVARHCGRRFIETNRDDDVIELFFFPEQDCFEKHMEPIGRPTIFSEAELRDHRVVEGEEWMDDMREDHHKLGLIASKG